VLNVYLLQSWYHVSDTKVRIPTTMSIYHRVDTTCQTQKYVSQKQLMSIDHREIDIVVVIGAFGSDTWYQLCDQYTLLLWYVLLGLIRGINSVINSHCCCNTYFWIWQQQCLFITELIPRIRPKSTHYNNNVYWSQSWHHMSDTKVRITTTMSIYHRVDTTCQTQKYVLQEQCLFITEL
jgi:hypothetical protein